MIEIVDLTPELAKQFEFTGQGDQFGGVVPISEMLPKLIEAGPAFAALVDKRSIPGGWNIVAVGGAAMLWPGVYEAWLMLNPEAKRYIKTLARAAKSMFKKIFDAGAHRIQTTVHCDSDKERRWVGFLGFELEGLLRQYGPDRADHYRVSILREDK